MTLLLIAGQYDVLSDGTRRIALPFGHCEAELKIDRSRLNMLISNDATSEAAGCDHLDLAVGW